MNTLNATTRTWLVIDDDRDGEVQLWSSEREPDGCHIVVPLCQVDDATAESKIPAEHRQAFRSLRNHWVARQESLAEMRRADDQDDRDWMRDPEMYGDHLRAMRGEGR